MKRLSFVGASMIKSAPFYFVVCDGCGRKANEYSDYEAWSDVDGAVFEATESGWTTDGEGRHHCHKCPIIGEGECDDCPHSLEWDHSAIGCVTPDCQCKQIGSDYR